MVWVELKEKFGEGTYHDCEVHNWSEIDEPDDKPSIDYFVQELGGTMSFRSYLTLITTNRVSVVLIHYTNL